MEYSLSMGFIRVLETDGAFVRPSWEKIWSIESILSSSIEPLLYAGCEPVCVLEYAESENGINCHFQVTHHTNCSVLLKISSKMLEMYYVYR